MALHKTVLHRQRTSYPNLRIYGQSSYSFTNSLAGQHEPLPTCGCGRSSTAVYTPAAIYYSTPNYIFQSLSCAAAARGPTVGLGTAAAGVAAAGMATTASRATGILRPKPSYRPRMTGPCSRCNCNKCYKCRRNSRLFSNNSSSSKPLGSKLSQTSPLIAQPTGFGSKNPFALSPSASAVPSVPQLPTPAPSHSPGPASSRSAPPTTSSVPTVKVSDNPENEALAALFANREGGADTFGNIGNLRYAVDFALCLMALTKRRYGHSSAGRALATTQTGPAQQPMHNDQPFFSV
jgi:hypothetical protein